MGGGSEGKEGGDISWFFLVVYVVCFFLGFLGIKAEDLIVYKNYLGRLLNCLIMDFIFKVFEVVLV